MNKLLLILLSSICWYADAAEQIEPASAVEPQQVKDAPQSSVPASAVVAQPTVEPEAPDTISVLDEPHEYLSRKFVNMVGDIDRFFGNERNYQEGNQCVLQLDLTRVTGYNGDRRIALGGRVKVHLPSTEKRLHLLIESDPDKNIGTDPLTQPATQATTPSSYAAALRFEKEQEGRWFFSTDAGLKFHGLSSSVFTRARASYSIPFDQWRMKFSESPFWFNTLGVGVSSQLDFERAVSAAVLFRASSNATWLHDKQNYDLRQDLTLYHTLDERRALLYQASAIGASQPQYHVSDYVLLGVYRYRLHQKWIFLELSPQMHYPQIRGYQPSPAFSVRLEFLFDRPK